MKKESALLRRKKRVAGSEWLKIKFASGMEPIGNYGLHASLRTCDYESSYSQKLGPYTTDKA